MLNIHIARFLLIFALLTVPASASAEEDVADSAKTLAPTESETLFLERLMVVESGGKLLAKNPRSSAFGPYQFIESTFFDLVTRHFPELAEDKSYAEIQQLRADLDVARNAALVYTRENAAFLSDRGIAPEPGYLRLAFLLGPSGAIAVISAKPETPVSDLVGKAALDANPFLADMSAEALIERAKREAAGLKPLPVTASGDVAAARPAIKVRCNLGLASCRKWLALAKRRQAHKLTRK